MKGCKMKAWFFSGSNKKLSYGDNRIARLGITHRVKFPVVINGTTYTNPTLCEAGLHGSKRIIDALTYAPGPYVWRVELSGDMDIGNDKISATERKYLWGFDATDILRRFARMCAFDVIHLWNAPDVVVRYLKTGDESLRNAARAATRAATWNAAWNATRNAAWNAAWNATRDATRAATWYAARDAARTKYNKRLTSMISAKKRN
jgi:hypothetical protein